MDGILFFRKLRIAGFAFLNICNKHNHIVFYLFKLRNLIFFHRLCFLTILVLKTQNVFAWIQIDIVVINFWNPTQPSFSVQHLDVLWFPHVVYFNLLSGPGRTRKMVELLFFSRFQPFLFILKPFSVISHLKSRKKHLKMNQKTSLH